MPISPAVKSAYSWKPGQSGNPGGRPRGWCGVSKKLRAKYGESAEELLARLDDMSRNADDERVKLAATIELLNRTVGKAPAELQLTIARGEDGDVIDMVPETTPTARARLDELVERKRTIEGNGSK